MKHDYDKERTFTALQKLSTIQLLGELPNCIWLVVMALLSKSVLVWTDLIDSANIICRETFVLCLSRNLKRNLSYRYNYGTGKLEAIASLCCDMLLLIGLVMLSGLAINDLRSPPRPADALVWVVVLKLVNICFDVYILVIQKRKALDSKVYRAEFASNFKNFIFDGMMLILFVISYFFQNYKWSWYVSPVFSIGLSVAFAYYAIMRMRNAVLELIDTTCDEQTQYNIMKVLTGLYDYYDEFVEVKSRIDSTKLLIDISVRFRPETTYEQIEQFSKAASEKLREFNPNCVVSIVIREDK